MKSPIKLPRFLAAGVLALSLLAAAPGVLPTQQAVAGQYDKVIITDRWGTKIIEEDDLAKVYNDMVSMYGPVPETKEEFIKGGITAAADEMGATYPKYELIAINGVPWQETEWAETIKNIIFVSDPRTGWVSYPSPYDALIMDSRLNGKGVDIDRLVKEGKTADEVRGILIKDKTTSNTDKKDVKESIVPTPTASTVDQAKDYQLVLTVGKSNGSEIKDGVSRPVVFDVAPEILEGSTMVPLRGVVDKFGADVTRDATSNSATVKMGDNTVTVQVDNKKATVNGKEITLTVSPVLKNGRVLIPLRFISQGIGLDVNWDDVTNSIIVKQPQKSTDVK